MLARGAKKLLADPAPCVLDDGGVTDQSEAGLSHDTTFELNRDLDFSRLAGALKVVSGVLIVDAQNRIQSVTEEAANILGFKPDQLVQRSTDLLPSALRQILRETVVSAKAVTNRQIESTTLGGVSCTLKLTTVPLLAKTESAIAVVFTHVNSTGWVDQGIQQVERLASLGTLAAGMAHEIRNALVAGKTFIDLLLEKNQDAELATLVRRELGRIDGMVSQMLKFASPSKPSLSSVHLHDLLNQCVSLLEPQIRSKAITLDRSFSAAPDVIPGDEFQLQQAFVNLLLNSLEAMGAAGTLSLATERCSLSAPLSRAGTPSPSQVRIIIKDSGTGIPAEHMARLFEPFFTTKPHGTGLGLPITRRIIQEHFGEISVASDGNQGATFSILLPASQ